MEYEELSLGIALAWIYARDHEFIATLDELRYAPVEAAFFKFNEGRKKKYFPIVQSIEETWLLLRDAIVKENLELRGVPFLAPDKVIALGREGTQGPRHPRHIPREVIPDLMIVEEPDQLILRPADWTTGNRERWRIVEVSNLEIFAHFPKTPRKLMRQLKPTHKNNIITRAIKEIWPDGDVLQDTMKERIAQLQIWIPKNVKSKSGKAESVDERTIRRYFDVFSR